jgi:hypothetical protein
MRPIKECRPMGIRYAPQRSLKGTDLAFLAEPHRKTRTAAQKLETAAIAQLGNLVEIEARPSFTSAESRLTTALLNEHLRFLSTHASPFAPQLETVFTNHRMAVVDFTVERVHLAESPLTFMPDSSSNRGRA